MKLMIVIVQEQDYAKLATLLIRNRIHATRFETSGLYSNKKNETLFICVEDEQQEQILDYIRESCTERKESCQVWEYNGNMMVQVEKTLKIGGATIFISEVNDIMKF